MISERPDRQRQSSKLAATTSRPRIILGSGRSGTTWVQDCLSEANNLRPVFEPLHQNESKVGARFAYDVLTASDGAQMLERYFGDIAAGRIKNRWIDYRAPKGLVFPRPRTFTKYDSTMRWLSGWRKYLRRRRLMRNSVNRSELLIKCIRGNLMADWFSRRLGYRTVFIVRHPCSVIESQLRLGKTWDPTPVRDRYRDNPRLHELTDGRYVELLNEELTNVEALTLNWVIENQWPIEHSSKSEYSVFFYEDLLSGGGSSWQLLCDSLTLSKTPANDLLQKPSQQSDPMSTQTDLEFHRPAWRNKISADHLNEIQRILDSTGCSIYHVESGNPADRELAVGRM